MDGNVPNLTAKNLHESAHPVEGEAAQNGIGGLNVQKLASELATELNEVAFKWDILRQTCGAAGLQIKCSIACLPAANDILRLNHSF
jgi:hypothetical protein